MIYVVVRAGCAVAPDEPEPEYEPGAAFVAGAEVCEPTLAVPVVAVMVGAVDVLYEPGFVVLLVFAVFVVAGEPVAGTKIDVRLAPAEASDENA